jgi:hypothetical protein
MAATFFMRFSLGLTGGDIADLPPIVAPLTELGSQVF